MGKKTVVEDCLALDANRWMREGILRFGVHLTGSWRWVYHSGRECSISYEVNMRGGDRPVVQLFYTGPQGSVEQPVALTTTRPRFGGLRWWFTCPLVEDGRPCRRRAGKLYLPPRARYFGCRSCYRLTYTSCQESHKYDGMYRLLAQDTGYDLATVKRAMDSIGKRRG